MCTNLALLLCFKISPKGMSSKSSSYKEINMIWHNSLMLLTNF